jgi:hypothetical protein
MKVEDVVGRRQLPGLRMMMRPGLDMLCARGLCVSKGGIQGSWMSGLGVKREALAGE